MAAGTSNNVEYGHKVRDEGIHDLGRDVRHADDS
jgi:hypothetical protein